MCTRGTSPAVGTNTHTNTHATMATCRLEAVLCVLVVTSAAAFLVSEHREFARETVEVAAKLRRYREQAAEDDERWKETERKLSEAICLATGRGVDDPLPASQIISGVKIRFYRTAAEQEAPPVASAPVDPPDRDRGVQAQ